MPKLYAVMLGEPGRGGSLKGLKADLNEATALAFSLPHCGDEWFQDENEPLMWSDGFDLLWIQTFDCADVYPTGFHYSGPGERSCQPVPQLLASLPLRYETEKATSCSPESEAKP